MKKFLKKGRFGLITVIFFIFVTSGFSHNSSSQSHISKSINTTKKVKTYLKLGDTYNSTIIHNLKPMDIILMKGRSRLSRSIEFVTQSEFSHVAIVLDPEKMLTIEATLNGVVKGNLYHYKGCSSVFRLKNITKEQSDKIVKFAEQQIGTSYDYEELIGLILRYVFHISLNDSDTGRYICSTFVNSAYASAGIRITNQNFPSPEDIFESPVLMKVADI